MAGWLALATSISWKMLHVVQAKPGSIADYLNKTEAALHHVDDGNFMGGKFDAHIKRVQQAIDKVQDTGLF